MGTCNALTNKKNEKKKKKEGTELGGEGKGNSREKIIVF